MAGAAGRSHRAIVGYVVLLATLLGVIALTASWAPRWGVDVLAGTRIVVMPQGSASGDDLRATADELEARARAAGASGAQARVRSDDAIQIAVPGAPDERVIEALRTTGEIAVRLVLAGPPPFVEEPEEPDDAEPEPGAPGEGSEPGADDVPEDSQEGAGLPGGVANDPPVEPEIPICPLPDTIDAAALTGVACGPVGGQYVLGPVLLTGADIASARAIVVDGVWGLDLDLALGGGRTGATAAVLEGLAARDAIDAERAEAIAARPTEEPGGSENPGDPGDSGEPGEPDAGEGSTGQAPLRQARLALVIDGDVVIVAPTPPTAQPGDAASATAAVEDGFVLLGGLDQPTSSALAERVDAGALPTPVASVEAIRLGSTLGPDEGGRGALAAGLGLLAALVLSVVLVRRRGALLAASTVAGVALSVPLVQLADQVVGLPLGLPVALTGLGSSGVLPLLGWAVAAVTEREREGRTPDLAARVAGAEVWRCWWPPVSAAAVGAIGVRALLGGEVGDVATMLATVLFACLIVGRLVTLPLAVMLAEREPHRRLVGAATERPAERGRRGPIAALLISALLVAATAGLLVRGIAADPAFTAGEEHSVVVTGAPVDARDAVRDAASAAGVSASSVRASGENRVLLATPRLDDAERADLVAALADIAAVSAPVASVELEAAGSGRSWILGGLILGVALVVGVAAAGLLRASPARRAPAMLAAVALAAVIGLGAASWVGLTWSPAALAALACVTVLGVVAQATLEHRHADHRIAVAAALMVLLPVAAVVALAPSVRAPFTLLLVGGIAALGLATVAGDLPVGSPRRERSSATDSGADSDRIAAR